MFLSFFFLIFRFPIKIVIMKMTHDRYFLELDIQNDWQTQWMFTVSFLLSPLFFINPLSEIADNNREMTCKILTNNSASLTEK